MTPQLSVHAVAVDALAYLKRRWTQPASSDARDYLTARDAEGNPCSPRSPKASSWTVVGALLAATDADEATPPARAVYEALSAHVGEPVKAWAGRAGRTQHEVISALEAVISKLKPEEG